MSEQLCSTSFQVLQDQVKNGHKLVTLHSIIRGFDENYYMLANDFTKLPVGNQNGMVMRKMESGGHDSPLSIEEANPVSYGVTRPATETMY